MVDDYLLCRRHWVKPLMFKRTRNERKTNETLKASKSHRKKATKMHSGDNKYKDTWCIVIANLRVNM